MGTKTKQKKRENLILLKRKLERKKKVGINYRERNNVHLGMWKVYLGIIFVPSTIFLK